MIEDDICLKNKIWELNRLFKNNNRTEPTIFLTTLSCHLQLVLDSKDSFDDGIVWFCPAIAYCHRSFLKSTASSSKIRRS